MKIGLIDIDSHRYPNLALMKLSAYHKTQGDNVEWYSVFGGQYDRVYMSKVFDFTPDYQYYVNADEVVKGGTGYALHGAGGETYRQHDDKPLPDHIEHIMPDYTLYDIKDTAYGFLTRGCPRGCDFCIVAKKEGKKSVKVAELGEFWNGQRNIVLCDPNILACNEREDLLQQLIESKANVDFNQGLDARLMTPDTARLLGEIKIKEIHFAWDRYHDKDKVLQGLQTYATYARKKPHTHNAIVYTLVNYDTTFEQDLERIYTLRDMGYWAYVMIYDKKHCTRQYKHLARWCNRRVIFAKCPDFKDYNHKLG